jgi:hypothetical protein
MNHLCVLIFLQWPKKIGFDTLWYFALPYKMFQACFLNGILLFIFLSLFNRVYADLLIPLRHGWCCPRSRSDFREGCCPVVDWFVCTSHELYRSIMIFYAILCHKVVPRCPVISWVRTHLKFVTLFEPTYRSMGPWTDQVEPVHDLSVHPARGAARCRLNMLRPSKCPEFMEKQWKMCQHVEYIILFLWVLGGSRYIGW